MKLGISLKIDVTKIEKERLFKGKNGAKYLDVTTFVDLDNPGQYGDHGFISQDVSKQERDNGVKGPILGNAKVFYNDSQSQPQAQQQGFQQHPSQTGGFQPQQQGFQPQGTSGYGTGGPTPPEPNNDFDDDTDSIPF